MERLREIADISKLGISIKDIISTCEVLGLYAKSAKVSTSMLGNAPVPLIVYWKNSHFVVLHKIDKNGLYHVADPSEGSLIFSREDFNNHFTSGADYGLIVMAEPSESFTIKQEGEEEQTLRKLFNLFKELLARYKKSFLLVCLLTILGLCSDIALPFIFRSTIDDGINGKDIGLVWMLVMSQFFIFLGSFCLSSFTNIILTKLGLNISFRMMSDYLNKVVSLPMSFFDRKVNSDLIARLSDQSRIKNFLITLPETAFFTILNLIVFSGILIYFDFIIFLFFITVTTFGLIWTLYFRRKRKGIDYSQFSLMSENNNNVYELVNGMAELKAHSAQKKRVEIWEKLQNRINSLTLKSTLINLVQRSGTSLWGRLRDIVVTGMCASSVVKGDMTIGDMMTVSYLVGRLATPVNTLLSSLNDLQDASISFERIESIMSIPDENSYLPAIEAKEIRFTGVGFKYPGSFSQYILKDLNCIIPKGKTTAIVGESGSGKTTFLKLLMGFYKPQEGVITSDGVDILESGHDKWLSNCGAVMQNGYIFSSSIIHNIALAEESPDMNRIKEAARFACIDKFIENLPMSYHTRIGLSGVELSGGQKQRLLIARVIYKNPQLVILDEATSSLDAENEREIVKNLTQFSKGRTMVIAAHRLCTVKNADQILFLKSGRITESGTHESLVNLRGDYFHLVKDQLELGE